MKHILKKISINFKDIIDLFNSLHNSIKYDSILEMCITWAVFIGAIIGIPFVFGIIVYAIICAIPLVFICVSVCILSFIVPFLIRGFYKCIKFFKEFVDEDKTLYDE